jgi:S1-C subfamily serine protease
MTARALTLGAVVLVLAVLPLDASSGPPSPLRVTVAAGALTTEVATGVPAGPERVLTVAHVLAGGRAVHVGTRPARVLHVDRRLDLALLDVPGLDAPEAGYARAGDAAEVHVLRDGRPQTLAVRVRRRVSAALKDPQTGHTDVRPALELAAPVLSGDSGAPVTDRRGRIVGIVFARALSEPATAWAVDTSKTAAFVSARR